ncbi:acyltransferase family protein [Yersinia enterocolitica]|nr:acyltransferase family protein [Yersinia enterocolitica]
MLATTPTQKIASNKFRNDINGLRAWAVIAVVLYHFGVPGFSGGFVGVDVFFVISGFLMTRIIVSGMESGNFSFLQFYLARARRIIPMLLVLCFALLIFGWFWLPEQNYKLLATHVVNTLFLYQILNSGVNRAISMRPHMKSGCYIPGHFLWSGSFILFCLLSFLCCGSSSITRPLNLPYSH